MSITLKFGALYRHETGKSPRLFSERVHFIDYVDSEYVSWLEGKLEAIKADLEAALPRLWGSLV